MWIPAIVSAGLSLFSQQEVSVSANSSGLSLQHDVAHLDIPVRQPLYAEKLDPNLIAFSIEADRWPDWAGYEVGKPNAYVRQLFDNLQQRTGHPPAIRVGADSEDRTHIDLSLPVGHARYPPRTPHFPYPEAEHIAVGRDWYALSANLAPGTPFTWGLNLKSLDIDETVRQAKLLNATFANQESLVLETIEIGNEPEYYKNQQSGGGVANPGDYSKWSPRNYTQTWTRYAKAVLKEFDKGTQPTLRIGEVQSAGLAGGWAPQSLFQAGLLEEEFVRDHLGVYSEHMYQTTYIVGRDAQPGVLMDKFNTRGNLSARVADVEACRRADLSFVLGETSSSSNHGTPGVSDVAESALWVIDFALQAASVGISRVYLSHGVGYRYSSFQPISGIFDDGRGLDRAHIMPMYYGMLVVNEAIGSSNATKHVAELGCLHRDIIAYGIYEDDRLGRLVLVNTQVHTEGARSRSKIEVSLDFSSTYKAGYTVKHLRVPYTQAYHDITWNGQSFDSATGQAEGKEEATTYHESSILLDASSAVLVTFDQA